jgi:hypothetical protein
MLELSRAKCERLQPTQEDWLKVKKDANKIYDEQFAQSINQEFLNHTPIVQTGGGRNRMVKLCYKLDKPLALMFPSMEFLNFKFESANNSMCLDIEWPWWPTWQNMMPELFNKGSIKQCLRNNCTQPFKDTPIDESPEKQECVKSCFMNSDPSLFDFTFFPLWTAKKYDPFGVVGIGVDFMKFSLNNLDYGLDKLGPLSTIFDYVMDLLGNIPIVGLIFDVISNIKNVLNVISDKIGVNILDLVNVFINLQEKNFEDAFTTYAATLPSAVEYTNTMEGLNRFLDTFLDGKMMNTLMSGANMTADMIGRLNPVNLLGNMVRAHTKDQGSKNAMTEMSSAVNQLQKNPETPETPATSGTTAIPATPATPATSSTTAKPATPATSSTTAKPETPATSSTTTKPATTAKKKKKKHKKKK